MINPREWLRTRRKLLDQVKAHVRLRLGTPPPALRRYAKRAEGEFRGRWTPAPLERLEQDLTQAQIVLGADFHAYAQSQRAHVRVLRDLVNRERVILAVECLRREHEPLVEQFLRGKISQARFLEKVHWNKNWGFPWAHYQPLFELARERGYRVCGLGQGQTENLAERDRLIARRLEHLHKAEPEALIYVVIGEWHVARAHLPKLLRARLAQPRRLLTLFQDAENLYFKLATQRQENTVDLMKGSEGRYCLMVSPPWMKWQSYLMYLEQTYDRDLQEDLAIDYSDHVVSLVELLEADLKIETKKSRVQVYCSNSRTSLYQMRGSLPKRTQSALMYHVEHGESFFLPERDWLYLSRPTINHASALAGQFVHAHLSRRARSFWSMPEDFHALVWIEAVAFFLSKWINPKRKAESLDAIRIRLKAAHPKTGGRDALLLTLDHRLSQVVWVQTGRLRRSLFRPRQKTAYFEAARLTGSLLGERLFQKHRSGTIRWTQLMSYLRIKLEDERFVNYYWQLIRDLERDSSV